MVKSKKKSATLSSLEEEHLRIARGEASKDEDTTEFENLFDDRKGNKQIIADDQDEEALSYFQDKSVNSFINADFENDKNFSISLTKQMEKEGISKAFGKKIKSPAENQDDDDEEEEEEDEDDSFDEEVDDEDDDEDDHLEDNFSRTRGSRSFETDDVVKHRLPVIGADGSKKSVKDVYINQEKKVEVKGVQKHPKQILKEKEEAAKLERQKLQQANKKQKLDQNKKAPIHKDESEDDEDESEEEEEDDEETVSGEKLSFTAMDIDEPELSEDEESTGKKKKLSEAELYLQKQQNIEQSKIRLAQISLKITENPENNIALLNDVFAICLRNIDMVVKRLGVLSLCAIFKDIIPGYKINSQLHKEDKESQEKKDGKDKKKESLSKEIKQTRLYEAKLLKFYQNYLVLVEGTVDNVLALQAGRKASHHNAFFTNHQVVEGKYTQRDLQAILAVVVKAASSLLVSKPHFNFRTNLVTLTARFTVYRDKAVAADCIRAVHDLFRNDTTGGQTALEVVRCMSNVAKATNYMLDPTVLRVFNSITLTDAVEKVNPLGAATDNRYSKKRRHFTQKERKERRDEKKLEKEMHEAEAEYTTKEQRYLQTEILKSIFITYFRIIKQAPHSPALTAVLEGLVRFAHLISVDFLPDLLAALASLIGRDTISLGNALNTSITAFKTVKQHGHTLNVDLKEYFSKIYSLLPQLVLPREQQFCLPAISALQYMLGERKQTAVDRVASFIKRVATLSTGLPANVSLALITFCKQLFVSFPRVQSLIETDNSYRSGAYNGETHDPDHCNPFSTSLWELTFFYNHWHPQFEPIVKRFLSFNETTAAQVTREKSPTEIYQLYDSSLGGFNPPIQPPKEHPLEAKLRKQKEAAAAAATAKKKAKIEAPMFIQVSQSEPSSFLKSISKKVSGADSQVSFSGYFNDIANYEKQIELKKKLDGLKRIKLKLQEKELERYNKLKSAGGKPATKPSSKPAAKPAAPQPKTQQQPQQSTPQPQLQSKKPQPQPKQPNTQQSTKHTLNNQNKKKVNNK